MPGSAAIAKRAKENLAAGNAALRAGDADRAADAMLRVLALDPENAEAAKALREIEKRRLAKIQAGRAAKVSGDPAAVAAAQKAAAAAKPATTAATATPSPTDAYDLEQPLEMFKAGDTVGGLRDLKAYVDANPNDKAARNRIGGVVYDRAKELESQGARVEALSMFEQAVALRGEPGLGWNLRISSLKKSLAEEYVAKGAQAWPANPAEAIRNWETALRYDPQNAKAAARLKEAKAAAPVKAAAPRQ